MSRQDRLKLPAIENVLSERPVDDDRLQIGLRLGLDRVAAAEEEELRKSPRRRPTRGELIKLAARLYEARRDRDRLFTRQLFGEPAWDMLLGLYCLPSRGLFLGITSLGHVANVPPTTGLRWQKVLLDEGLIKHGPRVSDARQQLVGLTGKGRMLMEQYLTRLFYCDGPLTDRDQGQA